MVEVGQKTTIKIPTECAIDLWIDRVAKGKGGEPKLSAFPFCSVARG
jgi:hypothetical protein